MDFLKITELAYNEFNKFLDEQNVTSKQIRIYPAGKSCHGTKFKVTVDKPKEGDLIQKVQDITFMLKKDLFIQYSGFILLCGQENGLGTFSLEPVFKPTGSGCNGCSSCPSSDELD